ncbi:uncharacterized protein VTP21DRAFT_849 [Calcarisporiella thermophila]|uniref:uncharacterized protein n=1 Tax=Calcarisporiella thermophila TaxID=911321 RepID=UPI0037428EB7
MDKYIAKKLIRHNADKLGWLAPPELKYSQPPPEPKFSLFRRNRPAENQPPSLPARDAKILKRVKRRANLLDAGLQICCCRIGIDPIIGMIPVVGDFIALLLAWDMIRMAKQADLPDRIVMQMYTNVAVDFVIGLVPALGDLFDFLFKANLRNSVVLENYLWERTLGLDKQSKSKNKGKEGGAIDMTEVPKDGPSTSNAPGSSTAETGPTSSAHAPNTGAPVAASTNNEVLPPPASSKPASKKWWQNA